MEIAGFVVAALALAVAGWSAMSARGANTRADEANRLAEVANARADDALNFQKLIDARTVEVRYVEWKGQLISGHDETSSPFFELTNTGLTTACDVHLVLNLPWGRELHPLGTIAPGDSRRAVIGGDESLRGLSGAAVLNLLPTAFRVHWASPAGKAETFEKPSIQIG